MNKIFLSIVIPFYNEEMTAARVITEHARLVAQFQGVLAGWEIIGLDDASTDRTWPILEECALGIPSLRLLRNEKNQGITRSFLRLFSEVRGTHVYVTAGDGQWPAENLARLLRSFEKTGADLVIGVRIQRTKVYGAWRSILSFGFNACARILFGLKVQDANGIKLGRKEIFNLPVVSKSFFSEVERLITAQHQGYQFVFCPVVFLSRRHGAAKGSHYRNLLATLGDMARYWIKESMSPTVFFIFLMFIYAAIDFFYGEKIPVNHGLGWDGENYGRMAKEFTHAVFIDPRPQYYYVLRIVPSAIVHFTLKFLHVPLEDQWVIKGFQVYNSILLLLSIYIFGKITKVLNLTRPLTWLAFVGLLFNYFILKQSFYYPVLTDVSAFFLGILTLHFYLKNQSLGVLAAAFIGAFAWPASISYGLLLYLFPRTQKQHHPANDSKEGRFNYIIALLVSCLFLAAILIPYLNRRFTIYPNFDFAPVEGSVILLSIFGLCVYLFCGVKELFRGCGYSWVKGILRNMEIRRVITAIVMSLVVGTITFSFSGVKLKAADPIASMAYLAVVKPMIFFVANVVYYGPIVLIAAFLWKPICALVRSYGFGLMSSFFLGFLLSIDAEARHAIFFFPFLAAFTTKALQQQALPRTFYFVMIFLSLCFSKAWMAINQEPFRGSFLEFPYQYYYMNHGPWMSMPVYLLQGGIILLSTVVLFRELFKAAPNMESDLSK